MDPAPGCSRLQGARLSSPATQPRSRDPREQVRSRALELGFDAIGFAPAALHQDARQRLLTFIEAGFHGEMDWLATRTNERSHPQALWHGARSVIILALSYAPSHDPLAVLSKRDRAAISAYAGNRDYHDLMKGRLKHLAQFMVSRFGCQVKVFVDTAPVMEKPLGQQGGLGWQGKHTNLVSRTLGSWFFLGEVFTDLELHPDQPESDHCGSCSRCLRACPTSAFTGPYQLDATRCISYLTIEHKGPIPRDLRPLMGNRIYGCDDCLAVCPWNRFAQPTTHPALRRRDDLAGPRLAELARLDDQAFRSKFAGSPIKRIGRDRFIRNVLTAIGNSADTSLLPVAQTHCADPNPVVAEAAAWACEQLAPLAQSSA
ncbi:MAG TPA: tRNA epoxyqueuosine(34) reductase QueG [Rhodopila sp.]|nr:tRNA epoxyqueuosine(34) reductase QueG [Rhodopila sp.]